MRIRSNAWMGVAERGSLTALYLLRRFYALFGRRASVALLLPIVAYFYLTGRAIRRASLAYLTALYATPAGARALGRAPRSRDAFRHMHAFAQNIFDRMILWSGDVGRFEIDDRGREHLDALVREKRGGILLSSHVGSFDMLRVLSDRASIALNILVFTEHAPRINEFFEKLDPKMKTRLIHFDPSSIAATLAIKAAIARGEFVGILGDRVWESERARVAHVSFLGRQASLPLGPFLLQAVLGCPMLLTTCVRTGPEQYRSTTLPFAPAGVIPRAERTKYAEQLAQRYATALEESCFATPYQWFNFFNFWDEGAAL